MRRPELESAGYDELSIGLHLFDLCLETHTPEQLEAGVYAEVHARGSGILTILPDTKSTLIPIKTSDINHSMWDEIMAFFEWEESALWQEMPEVIRACKSIALSQFTVKNRGIFRQDLSGKRRFTLITSPEKFEDRTYESLQDHFGISEMSYGGESRLYEAGEEEIFDFKPLFVDVEYCQFSDKGIDPASTGKREIGHADTLKIFRPKWQRNFEFIKDRKSWYRSLGAVITAHSYGSDIHSSLIALLEQEDKDEEKYLDVEYLQSKEYADELEKIRLDRTSGNILQNSRYGDVLGWKTRVLAQHMIDFYGRDVKIDIAFNPNEDIETLEGEPLYVAAADILAVYLEALKSKIEDDMSISAALIINADRRSKIDMATGMIDLPKDLKLNNVTIIENYLREHTSWVTFPNPNK